jgi:hypothetical protein
MKQEQEPKPKRHKRVVNLDELERPENSLYLAVQFYGKVLEPTRIERILLKLYNSPRRLTQETLTNTAEYVRTRFSAEYPLFRQIVFAYEAYAHVYRNVHNMGEATNNLCYVAMAWLNETMLNTTTERQEQKRKIAKKLRDSVEAHAVAQYAMHEWFLQNGVPGHLLPYPFRFEMKLLLKSIETLDIFNDRFTPREWNEKPPMNWDIADIADIEHNQRVLQTYRDALQMGLTDAKRQLDI